MEDLVIKLVERIPVAAAVIITVWLFLKQQRQLSKEWCNTVERITRLSGECQEECTTAVRENSQMLGRVAELIDIRIKQNRG